MRRKRSFLRNFRQYKRFLEVITILIKHNLTDYIKIFKLGKISGFIRKLIQQIKPLPIENYSDWQLIRMALEELGPTFIKLGQLISNRSDMLHDDLVLELAKLRDDCPFFLEKDVKRILREEFKCPINKIFSFFEMKPVAAGSIAQVHKAKLLNGNSVAVKIQRPDIEKVIDTDLDILASIASFIEKYVPDLRFFRLVDIVKELRIQMKMELNFSRELLHIQKFKNIFNGNKSIYVPKVYKNISTRKILTMEYINGVRISDVKNDTSGRFNRKTVAYRGAKIVLDQILIHGFFHSDPHPGNIIILENNVICFIDYGMMGRIRPKEKEHLVSLVLGMAWRDTEMLTQAILKLTRVPTLINTEELEIRIYDLLEEYIDLSLENLDIKELFNDLMRVCINFGLHFPPNLMLMIKVLVITEGIGRDLYPQFQLMTVFKPIAKKLFARKFHPKMITNEMFKTSLDYKTFLQDLPIYGKDILKLIKNGQLKVGFNVSGLELFHKSLEGNSYRLVFGIILSGLLVSSSLLIHSNLPPKWHNIPIIGLLGFAAAGIIGFVFLILLFRLLGGEKPLS